MGSTVRSPADCTARHLASVSDIAAVQEGWVTVELSLCSNEELWISRKLPEAHLDGKKSIYKERNADVK